MQDRRPVLAERIDRELVQRLRPGEPAEDGEDGRIRGKPEARFSPPRGLPSRCACGTGLPTTRYFSLVPSRHRVREEDAPCERGGESVREPEMGVRLGQRRRDPAHTRREHHRPGHVPARAEDDVRAAPGEDPSAGERRADGAHERTYEVEAELPWKSRDRERVELVPGVRNQLRLDAIGRPGEGHVHAARAQCFRDCERRPDVSGGSPGCDQARELRRPAH